MISSFDPYYSNAINFVSQIRKVMKRLCENAAPSKQSYTCYLSGGSINEVDLVNVIFAQFPWVLLTIVVIVFCVMGLFFQSAFVPLRLFATIALPLTFVYGFSISVYQKGLLDGLHWDAVANTQGLFWLSPIMTVTILIGLALDYDVFLFARVYEYRVHGIPTREAIVRVVAVLVDTFIIRTLLVPAVLAMAKFITQYLSTF
ncbi:hypothetical protein RFI_37589, partial [Reticulomyxa filosa]